MQRPALLFVLAVAACSGKSKSGTTTDPGGTGDPGVVKQLVLSFGTESLGLPDADPPKTRVSLTVTDETGAATSYPMGEIAASCSAEPGGEMGAYGTLRCWHAGGGANFIVVGRGGELILLRQETDEGQDEPADYEELSRVSVPVGAAISFTP